MSKTVIKLFLLAVVVMGFSAIPAWAQKPIKGNWTFTVQTPMGALPIPVSFKSKGKGTLVGPGGALPLSYRESGNKISVAVEGPGLNPDGSDLTIVIRGTKTDTAITATGAFITDTVDASSPVGFTVLPLPVSGARQ